MTDFHDDYDHPPNLNDHIEYILECTLMPAPHPNQSSATELDAYHRLSDLYHSAYSMTCTCSSSSTISACTTSHTCTCTRASTANYIAATEHDGELLLNPRRACADLLYECSSQCACPPDCGNRRVQFGPRRDLRVVRTACGWGVITAAPIGLRPGAFVCEYAGELLTAAEARRRQASVEYAALGANYVLCLNERDAAAATEEAVADDGGGDGGGGDCGRGGGGDDEQKQRQQQQQQQTFIDPTRRGNVGRYLNHSCDPNCEILSVRIGAPIPRLGIFTRRTVKPGEELCFDYAGGNNVEADASTAVPRTPCLCGTTACRGFLPNVSYG